MDGDVRDDIDRQILVFLRIVETVHLNDVFVGGEGLHYLRLQLGMAVLASGNGIDTNGHDDTVSLVHRSRDSACQPVNIVGRHRVIDVDVLTNEKEKDFPIYDLNGVRQNVIRKGINVIGGKKVVIK